MWLESAGETAGVAADSAAFAELVPLIRDIWIESEPRNGCDRALRDEIVVRSSIHNQVFASNDAGERQDMLVTAVRDAAASSTGDMIEIELIPRAGRAGLVVTGKMLEDIAASGHGLRLVAR
ncbi:hypothetical protein [Microbacterium sp. 179-I 3D4 NHS]|uniref:hypothetical protein n=1 Tax=Microbacterium sp. 179-I 3D4 NHS TaxID=3142381 RepID=UPI0039A3AA46